MRFTKEGLWQRRMPSAIHLHSVGHWLLNNIHAGLRDDVITISVEIQETSQFNLHLKVRSIWALLVPGKEELEML
jgi:hypothetical protein